MPSYPVRRAQLITTFGPGAMMVARDGISVMCCGLDHWFQHEPGHEGTIDLDEYRVEEWRLQRALDVRHFRLPPDLRIRRRGQEAPRNSDLTIPFVRFPRWHHCTQCTRLTEQPLEARGALYCPKCERAGKRLEMTQVRFVAVCDRGHIQDFPWREWVHRSTEVSCTGALLLVARGGTTLASQIIRCEGCRAWRSLSGITVADRREDTTRLTEGLEDGAEFRCQGLRPWLGTALGEECGRPLRATLRSASNVWYSQVRSAIYLPTESDPVIEQLRSILRRPPFSTALRWARGMGKSVGPAELRSVEEGEEATERVLRAFSDEQLSEALRALDGDGAPDSGAMVVAGDDPQTAFRRAEHHALRNTRHEEELRVRLADLSRYDAEISRHFGRMTLVERLRETRAFSGFSRVFPETEQSVPERKAMLWSDAQARASSWLPAYVVHGEGFYLELSESRLAEWLRAQGGPIMDRIRPLSQRAARLREDRRLPPRPIGPRFVLLHTLAHLLMNQLVFECGYSAASLGERLYVSDNPSAPMAGVLIYTAAGDADGTLGGLVRQARQGEFEMILRRALERARWCSADPVCMEMGRSGQGPMSTNLAACHSCCLLPETACEEFNQFLDRGLVIGDLANRDLAFFRL